MVPVPVRVCGRELLVGEVWHGDDEVGLLGREREAVTAFRDVDALTLAAADQGYTTDPRAGSKHVDLDAATGELRSRREVLDCTALLSAWDLIEDLGDALGRRRPAGALRARVHDKLFWGSNLPSVVPSDALYVPSWSRRERRVLRRVTVRGSTLMAELAEGAS